MPSIIHLYPTLTIAILAIIQILLFVLNLRVRRFPITLLFSFIAICSALFSSSVNIVGSEYISGIINYGSSGFVLNTTIIIAFLFSFALVRVKDEKRKIAVQTLMIFATVGALLMIAATDFILLFIGIEILSISLYALSGANRDEKASTEASLKYFILGTFASAFLLLGFTFIYGLSGSIGIAELTSDNTALVKFALGLITFGFAFKIGLSPFNFWRPDTYQGAPSAVTCFMVTVAQVATICAFTNCLYLVFAENFSTACLIVIYILAILSMIIGNLLALVQDSIKRMLAYASIAHAGYILLGVLFIITGEFNYSSISYYFLVYIFMTIGAFAVLITLENNFTDYRDADKLSALKSLGWINPVLAIQLTIFMLSLAGIPPLAGFVAKFYVFSDAISADAIWLVAFTGINCAISFCYYGRIIAKMYFRENVELNSANMTRSDSDLVKTNLYDDNINDENSTIELLPKKIKITFTQGLIINICAITVIVFGVWTTAFSYLQDVPQAVGKIISQYIE